MRLIYRLISFCLMLLMTSPHVICQSTKRDYRQDMRQFIIGLSTYAKSKKPGFSIIPQNGQELITKFGSTEKYDTVQQDYLNAIDGHGREDLFFGYPKENMRTPPKEQQWMISPLILARSKGKTILVTDYTDYPQEHQESYAANDKHEFIGYAASYRQLDHIPNKPPHNASNHPVRNLSAARNFLYILDSSQYETRDLFLEALKGTDYDIILIDAFFSDGTPYQPHEIKSLKVKRNGAPRLVLAYMSIGEAETYRFYWKKAWNKKKPSFLGPENPHWKGNYKVKYWDKSWQKIIYGTKNSYLDQILSQGFDGVYLDIVDAFYHFEES